MNTIFWNMWIWKKYDWFCSHWNLKILKKKTLPCLKNIQIPLHVGSDFQCQEFEGAVSAVVHWRLHLILLIHWRLGCLLQKLDDQLHWCWICVNIQKITHFQSLFHRISVLFILFINSFLSWNQFFYWLISKMRSLRNDCAWALYCTKVEVNIFLTAHNIFKVNCCLQYCITKGWRVNLFIFK